MSNEEALGAENEEFDNDFEQDGSADFDKTEKADFDKTEKAPDFDKTEKEAAEPTGGEKPPRNNAAPVVRIAEADSTPAAELDNPPPADTLDRAVEENVNNSPSPQGQGGMGMSQSAPGLGAQAAQQKAPANDDLKAKTMFSQSTVDGVLKRTIFIHSLSTYPTAPQCTIASKGESMFQRSGQGPAPGSYNLPHEEKSRFKTSARFSFGGGSRFGLGGSPTKLQPGPGQYNPKDPSLYVDTKVGFGTSVRNKGPPSSQAAPGPGAYEQRSTVGGGLMFTACGRHPTSYMRSRSLPGPGTYAPTLNGAYQASPKCGFGTSTRAEFGGGSSRGQPGPGTYEMQNFKSMGKDSKKFSATSRRRVHDLSSYVTPGPGTYNAHATSFGAPGAASCAMVDDGYKRRNAPAQEA